jgi:hypothetical protein
LENILILLEQGIKTFLNAKLVGTAYLAGGKGRVLRLKRSLYGLRQAPRAWNKRLETELSKLDFVQSDADPSLWIPQGKDGVVLALFYVDDGLVAARTATEADALVDRIALVFAIRKVGEPQDFLGIRIVRELEAGTIPLTQEDKALALAAELGVAGESKVIPMSPETFSGLRKAQEGDTMGDKELYQSGIGSLLHLAQCTRPDIALGVGALAAGPKLGTLFIVHGVLNI